MCGSKAGEGAGGQTPKNYKAIGFLILTNHKAAKPAFNVGPSSADTRAYFSFRLHTHVETRKNKSKTTISLYLAFTYFGVHLREFFTV